MKPPITLDFETYYDDEYTLKKLATEDYVRHPKFKAHGVGVYIAGEDPQWITSDIKEHLLALELDQRPVLGQHMHFDGLILSHHFGIYPKFILDTLSMGRALGLARLDLGGMAERYGLGMKPTERLDALKGVRDLTPEQLASLGEYCANDVMLTHFLFNTMRPEFSVMELMIIDCVVKMFTQPVLRIDGDMAAAIGDAEVVRLQRLLDACGTSIDDLMSSHRFAEVLRRLGVEPPMKVSPRTGKQTFATSKQDKAFTDLLHHPDQVVRAVVEARMGAKSTIVRTRATSLEAIAKRTDPARKDTGWPVYLRYSGARQTHRLSGADKVNPQNLNRGSLLRKAIHAPDGYVLVACDSSNIELRVDMTLAGQWDVVDALRRGVDMYCEFASLRYGRVITKKDKFERQYGKTAMLGLGFGMGADKFVDTARLNDLTITPEEGAQAVNLYRGTYTQVPAFWTAAKNAIPYLLRGATHTIDPEGLIYVQGGKLFKPSGMPLLYQNLRQQQRRPEDGGGMEWVYDGYDEKTGQPKVRRIYGGKMVENIVQAVARDIVMEQMVTIAKRYRVVMSVHDEVVCCVKRSEAAACEAFMVEVMSTSPTWFPNVPLACEASVSFRYGDCK